MVKATDKARLYLLSQVRCYGLGTTFSINCRTDDAASITSTLATGEESGEADVLEGLRIANDAYRTAGSRLYADDGSLVCQETVLLAAPCFESLLQTQPDGVRQPEVQGTADEPWGIRRLRQVVTETIVDEVSHTLGRSRLFSVSLLPTKTFQLLLIVHHP